MLRSFNAFNVFHVVEKHTKVHCGALYYTLASPRLSHPSPQRSASRWAQGQLGTCFVSITEHFALGRGNLFAPTPSSHTTTTTTQISRDCCGRRMVVVTESTVPFRKHHTKPSNVPFARAFDARDVSEIAVRPLFVCDTSS